MNKTKKPILTPSQANDKRVVGLTSALQAGIEPHLGGKCIECGEPAKTGNKFCKKTYCRNKNFWRRQLTAEIEDAVRADERKKVLDKISSKLSGVMRVMFNLSDSINNLKEEK
ncbi:MAG: hypothetical protein KAR20_24860 [Candidatus Heimdallarchaeota archaeon]|nr:hypothetical protein [Candidatus Heimdallarchaeota archaeon]